VPVQSYQVVKTVLHAAVGDVNVVLLGQIPDLILQDEETGRKATDHLEITVV